MSRKIFLEKLDWQKSLNGESPFSDLPDCDRAIRRHLSIAIERVLGKPPVIIDRISREEFRQIDSAVKYIILYSWRAETNDVQQDWYKPELRNAGGGTFEMRLAACREPDI